MHCRSCGAPHEFVDGRDYFSCGYCSTHEFPTDLADSADRLVDLQQPGKGTCPGCRCELVRGTLERRAVEFCPTCRGCWIPKESFSRVVADRRAAYRGADRTPLPLCPSALAQPRRCPGCAATMEVHPYYGPGNVVIDSCRHCGTVWLDHGEVAAIERSPGRR